MKLLVVVETGCSPPPIITACMLFQSLGSSYVKECQLIISFTECVCGGYIDLYPDSHFSGESLGTRLVGTS